MIEPSSEDNMPDSNHSQDTDSIAALSDLVTDVVDVIKGYEIMQERAEPDLRPAVDRLHDLHAAHCTSLMEHLEGMGGRPEDAGSMMGAVHMAVATARDWFGALDGSALESILNGEQQLIDSYTTALRVPHTNATLIRVLEDQRAALRDEVVALRAH
jgi:uncharacterized protein (TIGR02284 family)